MPTALRTSALAVTLVVAALLTGCSTSQLQFKNDNRLSFQAPAERKKVDLPLTVAWTMKDFTATGLDGTSDDGKGVYAVFVDRAPMPVGKDLRWVFRDDGSCKRDTRCPTPGALAEEDIYLTTKPTVTVANLPTKDGVGDEQHEVTVVLLDGTGTRLKESAWYRPFRLERRDS